jgi:Mn2+/Fe2+ NRAMP family transporter
MAEADESSTGPLADPPTTFGGIVRQLGPGLIIAASIVGSGELVVTTKLGADIGFQLLWFIILGCLIKVFVQIELGRYAIARGSTTLQALDSLPGPRLGVGWMVYVWLLMFIATFFQLAGMVGAIARVFQLGGLNLSETQAAVMTSVSCSVLLALGRYRWIEKLSALMVALFTLLTILAVLVLHWTPYAVTLEDLREGLRFQLPERFTIAFAAFGIIGVGAAELIYYPYWCLEKGYARNAGPCDGSEAWGRRARGWMRVLRADAWFSMVIYTTATVAFYLLGATVLHRKSIPIDNSNLIDNLSHMYRESFGMAGLWCYLLGAFVVLYSTVFISSASGGRLCADVMRLLGFVRPEDTRRYDQLVWTWSVLLPLVFLLLYVLFGNPLDLVLMGAVGQAVMLPLLCGATLYFHHNRMEPALRTSRFWTLLLWLASLCISVVALYELVQKLRQFWAV